MYCISQVRCYEKLRKMFNLRIQPSKSTILKHHRSAADDKILRRKEAERKEQLLAAVQYCTENECKGYAAVRRRIPIDKGPADDKPLINQYCRK